MKEILRNIISTISETDTAIIETYVTYLKKIYGQQKMISALSDIPPETLGENLSEIEQRVHDLNKTMELPESITAINDMEKLMKNLTHDLNELISNTEVKNMKLYDRGRDGFLNGIVGKIITTVTYCTGYVHTPFSYTFLDQTKHLKNHIENLKAYCSETHLQPVKQED